MPKRMCPLGPYELYTDVEPHAQPPPEQFEGKTVVPLRIVDRYGIRFSVADLETVGVTDTSLDILIEACRRNVEVLHKAYLPNARTVRLEVKHYWANNGWVDAVFYLVADE